MNSQNQDFPSLADIRHYEVRARQLRAEAMRDGSAAIASYVASLFHKLTATTFRPRHS